MADRSIYTSEASMAEAVAMQSDLAASLVRLFDSALVPLVTTTLAELEEHETKLTGYPAGGYPVAAFKPPVWASGGGAVIYSPTIDVVYTAGPEVVVGGYWLEDSDGKVRSVVIYDPPRTLARVGDGWPLIVQMGFGRN